MDSPQLVSQVSQRKKYSNKSQETCLKKPGNLPQASWFKTWKEKCELHTLRGKKLLNVFYARQMARYSEKRFTKASPHSLQVLQLPWWGLESENQAELFISSIQQKGSNKEYLNYYLPVEKRGRMSESPFLYQNCLSNYETMFCSISITPRTFPLAPLFVGNFNALEHDFQRGACSCTLETMSIQRKASEHHSNFSINEWWYVKGNLESKVETVTANGDTGSEAMMA